MTRSTESGVRLTALRPKATVRSMFCCGPGISVRKSGYPSAKKPFAPAVSAALDGAYSSFSRLYHALFSCPYYKLRFPDVNGLAKEEKSLLLLLSSVTMHARVFVGYHGENGTIWENAKKKYTLFPNLRLLPLPACAAPKAKARASEMLQSPGPLLEQDSRIRYSRMMRCCPGSL